MKHYSRTFQITFNNKFQKAPLERAIRLHIDPTPKWKSRPTYNITAGVFFFLIIAGSRIRFFSLIGGSQSNETMCIVRTV